MSDEQPFTLNTKQLDGMLKAMKENMFRARIGILGGKSGRGENVIKAMKAGRTGKSLNAPRAAAAKQGNPTNAEIGAYHEYNGRSFLRMPISENLQKELEAKGAFSEDEVKQVVAQASFVPWLKKIATLAEKIVSDAFDTGGFGKWPKWKTPGYTNNTGQILVDTQQLRNSITSEVK